MCAEGLVYACGRLYFAFCVRSFVLFLVTWLCFRSRSLLSLAVDHDQPSKLSPSRREVNVQRVLGWLRPTIDGQLAISLLSPKDRSSSVAGVGMDSHLREPFKFVCGPAAAEKRQAMRCRA